MKYTQDMIAVMQAFCNGRPIEARTRVPVGLPYPWVADDIPAWNWENVEYRIKKTKKTYYMGVDSKEWADGSRNTSNLAPNTDVLLADGWKPNEIIEITLET